MKENSNKRTVTRTFRGVSVNVVIADKPPKPAPEKKTKEVYYGNLFTSLKKKVCLKTDDGLIEAKEYLKVTYGSRQRADRRHVPIIDDHKSRVLGEELDLGDKLK